MRRRELLQATAAAALAACAAPAATTPAPVAATAPAATTSTPSAAPTPTPAPSPTIPPLRGCAPLPADPARSAFVDTHAHLDALTQGGSEFDAAAESMLPLLSAPGVRTSIVMPMPFPSGRTFDVAELAPVAKRCPARLAFMAGGGSLNVLIHENPGTPSAELRKRFDDKAAEIVAAGAVGFGEMGTLHLSFNAQHPFSDVPADHPLFRLLAELAAKHDVAIDLHHDAITRDMPTPPRFRQLSPNNPASLKENLAGFERLLAHERRARIVWAHVGNDQTGQSTPALYRRLLGAHPNLFLQLKAPQAGQGPGGSAFPQNDLLQGDRVHPDWLEIIRAFPERMVVGGDNFFASPNARQPFQRPPSNLDRLRTFLGQLPADIARKVASDNAVRIYRLPA